VYNETLVRLDAQPDTADAVESGYGGIEYGDLPPVEPDAAYFSGE
jgi:hypothetical protein